MKKLLMIAHAFPPSAVVGIYRTIKFAKYLPANGWQPIVLAASNGKYQKYDEDTLDLVPPGVRVYRAWGFEAFNQGESGPSQDTKRKRTFTTRVMNRLKRTWAFFMIPDANVTWVPGATLKALSIVRREGIEHVYVSGKPFSSFIIGYWLKKLRGVHLTIDYRDPWTQSLTYQRRSALHAWIERHMERIIVRNSDVVVANTRVNEAAMVRDFGDGRTDDRFVTIHNGFDCEDFAAVHVDGPYDKFTITYAGGFYFSPLAEKGRDDILLTYSPLVFFEALRKWFAQDPAARELVRVNFMGSLAEGYDPIITEMGLDGVVHRLGYLDYEDHLAVLKRSHATLLVLSSGERSRGWVPSKFYSYLGAGGPVLALVPEGEARDIIRACNAGVFVEPDDVDGTVRALIELSARYERGEPFERNEDEVGKFDRSQLTEKLARALQRAASGARETPAHHRA